jgi:wobble nucleotide-excising tRNase
MVLGMILYEGVDLLYNVVRLSYNGVTGTYNWWYKVEEHEKEEKHKEAMEMIAELKKLNNRVKELECTLVESKT